MEKAENFCLENQDGEKVCLKDFKGKVVLYFYPRDGTPGCTLEAKQFNDLKKEFDKLGVTIFGISSDDTNRHKKFCDKHGLGITLLSDPDFEVHKKYGAYGEKNFFGKKIKGTIRSTLLVENGKVIKHWPKVSPIGHAGEVLGVVKNL